MSCWLAAVMIWVTRSAEEATACAVRSPAVVTAVLERSLVDSSRSSRLLPRSLKASIMELPA